MNAYEEPQEARRQRYEARAEKARKEADQHKKGGNSYGLRLYLRRMPITSSRDAYPVRGPRYHLGSVQCLRRSKIRLAD
jgi:hypothetical protein